MTNQSELEQLLDYLYEKGYDSGDGMSKYPKDVAILETQAKIQRYITANYTPNSEVARQVREAELTFVERSADYYKQWESELTKGEQ